MRTTLSFVEIHSELPQVEPCDGSPAGAYYSQNVHELGKHLS